MGNKKDALVIIDHTSLADRVYEKLKLMILSGQLAGGERISEEQLAGDFDVSRTPIREALKRLSNYGLVSLKPRSFAIVSDIDAKEAAQIGEVRVSLEKLAMLRISHSPDPDFFLSLERIATECLYNISLGERAKAFELDSDFHSAIVNGADNAILADLYERLDAKIQLLRLKQKLSSEELLPYMMQHMQIIQLLRNGNVEQAAQLVETHNHAQPRLKGPFSANSREGADAFRRSGFQFATRPPSTGRATPLMKAASSEAR